MRAEQTVSYICDLSIRITVRLLFDICFSYFPIQKTNNNKTNLDQLRFIAYFSRSTKLYNVDVHIY